MTDLMPVPDEKEIAFNIWMFVAGRNATRTAKILAEAPSDAEQWDREPMHIPARTIRDWVHRYRWEEKADKLLRETAPGIHAHVVQETVIGSLQSIQHLRDVVEGKVEASDKVRLDAAKSILDRAGHLPWTRGSDGSVPSGPTRNYAESVAGKTTEEIARMLFGGDEPDEE